MPIPSWQIEIDLDVIRDGTNAYIEHLREKYISGLEEIISAIREQKEAPESVGGDYPCYALPAIIYVSTGTVVEQKEGEKKKDKIVLNFECYSDRQFFLETLYGDGSDAEEEDDGQTLQEADEGVEGEDQETEKGGKTRKSSLYHSSY